MAFDRKSASAKRDLQRPSPTIVQKREIFERRTRKSKALKVMYFLSRPIGAAFGLSSLFYHHAHWVYIFVTQWHLKSQLKAEYPHFTQKPTRLL